jgi:hypothetical protein
MLPRFKLWLHCVRQVTSETQLDFGVYRYNILRTALSRLVEWLKWKSTCLPSPEFKPQYHKKRKQKKGKL